MISNINYIKFMFNADVLHVLHVYKACSYLFPYIIITAAAWCVYTSHRLMSEAAGALSFHTHTRTHTHTHFNEYL